MATQWICKAHRKTNCADCRKKVALNTSAPGQPFEDLFIQAAVIDIAINASADSYTPEPPASSSYDSGSSSSSYDSGSSSSSSDSGGSW